MASNPMVDQFGLPVPFVGESIVLKRSGIEFHVDHIASLGGKKWVGKGDLYLTTIRLVFVSSQASQQPSGGQPVVAFDMPLLYMQGEKFNQPIFGCNNISGRVLPVQADIAASGQVPHNFVIYFMEGGVGTFLPLFGNLLRTVRGANAEIVARVSSAMASGTVSSTNTSTSADRNTSETSGTVERVLDPIPKEPPAQILSSMRSAYVDPQDPTVVYVEQPASYAPTVRRRKGYQALDS